VISIWIEPKDKDFSHRRIHKGSKKRKMRRPNGNTVPVVIPGLVPFWPAFFKGLVLRDESKSYSVGKEF